MRTFLVTSIAFAGLAIAVPAIGAPATETRAAQAIPQSLFLPSSGGKEVRGKKNHLAEQSAMTDDAANLDDVRARRKVKRRGLFFGLGGAAAAVLGGAGAGGAFAGNSQPVSN